MCGIAGIVNHSQIDSLERHILAMQAALRHRGPDDAGVYLSSDRGTALAHTRLSILDLSTAGHWLRWQSGDVKQYQYWQIQFGNEPISEHDAQERVRQALIDSIAHHFISDVPVGIFLSGGIDSTSLVALARHTRSADLHTYSIAFAEPEWNEGSIAHQTAEHFGTQHHELFITPAIAKQIFPKFLTFLDQPTIDGFNTFCVSQLAREQGTKVVLSGLGGDEIFGGYKSFQQLPRLVKYGRILQPFKPISKLIGQGLTSWSPQPQLKRLGEYLQRSPNTTNAMGAMRGIFTRSEAEIIAQKYLPPDTPFPAFIPNAIAGCPSLEDEVSVLELSGYMRNQLLHDSDVMSMAWGLELRVPFVDRVLLETVASIPSKLRLAPKKQILVNAILELPTWVTNQPKRGFIFPFQQWFEADEEWNNYLPQVKLPPQVSINLWYRRWNLTILDYWWQQNVQ